MDSSLISISKIFTERLLRIPDYQRGYAWTEKEVSEFWNDLMFLEEEKNHYVGVLTLEEVPKVNVDSWIEDHWIIYSKSYKPSYIVDGQQRITTVILLIQSIIEEVKGRGNNDQLNYTDLNDIRKKFIFEEKSNTNARSYIFGYDKDNPSYEYLKKKIFLEDSPNAMYTENTIYTQNLTAAKLFFQEKLKDKTIPAIELIYKKCTQQLLFNIYSLDEEIDTYVAFETMNNRGKPLSHLELLKNRLIYLSTKIDIEDYHKSSLRHSINECWKAMYHFLGRDMTNRLDDDEFLYNHSINYFTDLEIGKNDDVSEDENVITIFEDLKLRRREYDRFVRLDHHSYSNGNRSILLDDIFSAKPISDQSRKYTIDVNVIDNYVSDLKKSVETWYFLHNPKYSNYDPEIIMWLERIKKLPEWKSSRLLLLAVFNKKNSKEEVISVLMAIERAFFVYTTCGRVYYRMSSFTPLALEYKRTQDLPAISLKIKNHTDKLLKSPTTSFASSFEDGDFYTWQGIRYFLYEYEYHLKNQFRESRGKLSWSEFGRSEKENDYYTIEHIFPQKATREYWKKLYISYDFRQKKQLRNSLGNLVPLSIAKNASLSNRPFPEKKQKFAHGCYSEIELTKHMDWTAKEIKERTIAMLYFLDTRWQMHICPAAIMKDPQKRNAHYLSISKLNF